jgi:DNA-binding NarL/FixJ family response regulator
MTNDGQGRFRLARREREVLQLILDGLSVKAIAWALGISSNTVARYVALFLRAFQCEDRAELVAWVRSQVATLVREGRVVRRAA